MDVSNDTDSIINDLNLFERNRAQLGAVSVAVEIGNVNYTDLYVILHQFIIV